MTEARNRKLSPEFKSCRTGPIWDTILGRTETTKKTLF